MIFSWLNLIRVLFMVGCAAFGLWLLRGPRPSEPVPGLRPRELWTLAGVLAVALALRALLIPTLPPGTYELENVPYDRVLSELTDQSGFGPLCKRIYHNFHTPLLPTFLDGWYVIGDAVGMGGDITWLRLPNLFAAAAFLLLLLRIGRSLGAAAVGWGAAAVFAVSPTLTSLSVYQGHYFLEMVTVSWFCERLIACTLDDRPVHRSLAAAAAVALWSGYMTVLVVVPGLLLYLVRAWRRGERGPGLAAVLVVAGLYGPIATTALETAMDFMTISMTENVGHAAAEGLFAVHGHQPMPVEMPEFRGLVGFPVRIGTVVFGEAVVGVALFGFALALLSRPRTAWFPAALLVLYAALSTRMAARWVNYTSILPFLLVVPLWGASASAARLRIPWLRNGLVALVAAGFVAGPVLAPARHERLPAAADMAAWVAGGERLSQVSGALQEDGHRDLPVLVLAVEKDVYYHLCPDRASLEGYLACKDGFFRLPRGDGLSRGLLEGRAVAFTQMDDVGPEDRGACPRLDGLRRADRWRGRPFLVLVTWGFRHYEEMGLCTGLFPREGCELLTEALHVRVLRCAPRD